MKEVSEQYRVLEETVSDSTTVVLNAVSCYEASTQYMLQSNGMCLQPAAPFIINTFQSVQFDLRTSLQMISVCLCPLATETT